MVNADVLQFACLTPNWQAYDSDAVRCDRQRWHPGDHRAQLDGRLYQWPDPPAPHHQEEPVSFGDRPEHNLAAPARRPHVHDPSCAFGNPQCDLAGPHTPPPLDEQAETWSPVVGELSGGPWDALARYTRALAFLVLLVAVICAPAVVIAAYRAAL